MIMLILCKRAISRVAIRAKDITVCNKETILSVYSFLKIFFSTLTITREDFKRLFATERIFDVKKRHVFIIEYLPSRKLQALFHTTKFVL